LIILGILFAMLFAVAGSIIAAEWMPGLDVILWAVVFSLLAGTALAHSNFPGWTAHLTSMVYGLFALGLIGTTQPDIAAQTSDWHERARLLFEKIFTWFQEALNNGTSRESVIFILILSALFWMLGYTAAWYSFRHRRIWHVILPAGVTLFSNVYYYAGPNAMAPFLLVYLLCAVTLLALSHLAEREESWARARVRFSRSLAGWFVAGSVVIAAIAGLFGWRLSEVTTSTDGRNFFERLNQPYSEFLARWNRLFANLNNTIAREVDSYASSVTLSGPRNLTADPVMDVLAPPARHYWRAASYDNYDGLTWRNTIETATNAQPFDTNIPLASYAERVPVQADFTLYRGTDSVYAPSQPLRSSVGTQATFEQVSNAAVNLVQLRLPVPLLPGNRYTAVGSVSLANVAQLRNAPGDYPAWVRARYLQLPPQVPERVADLARNIAARAPTAFDKAAAIERWLRANIAYDERLPAPPPGVEASDYVLFDVRRAYCNYYATAMVTMLRSLGIPSRVAVGYAQGEIVLDPSVTDRALYHVRADDSHMWVEVFFPEFGWVEFEPTAGQPPIERFEPQAEATPTAEPTSPPPTPTPRPQEAEQPAATPTPEPQTAPADSSADRPSATNEAADEPPGFLDRLRNSWLPYLLLIPLVIAAALGALRYLEGAGLGRLPGVERAYAMLTRYAGWLNIGRGRQFTPYEQAEALAQRAPQAQVPVQRITDLYVHKRFSPPKDADSQRDAREALQALSAARRALRMALLKARLWRDHNTPRGM
jgi:transglutaminase-like putative cysteine protease